MHFPVTLDKCLADFRVPNVWRDCMHFAPLSTAAQELRLALTSLSKLWTLLQAFMPQSLVYLLMANLLTGRVAGRSNLCSTVFWEPVIIFLRFPEQRLTREEALRGTIVLYVPNDLDIYALFSFRDDYRPRLCVIHRVDAWFSRPGEACWLCGIISRHYVHPSKQDPWH